MLVGVVGPGAKLEPQPVASRTGVMTVAACDCVAANA